MDGRPLKKVRVVFVPTTDYGPEYAAVGETDEAGRFTLTCNGKPGACSGENRVIVQETDAPPHLRGTDDETRRKLREYMVSLGGRPVPAKYGNLVGTPLTADVAAERPDHTFDLAR
jgi:hypothetical protein